MNLSIEDASAVAGSSLRDELLSGDDIRVRAAAAFVRAQLQARTIARESGTSLVFSIDGVATHLDPDSPLLPDLTELQQLAERLVPLNQ